MENEVYVSPCIQRVTVYLEQAIAGSIPITPVEPSNPNTFQENWIEEEIITGDIELL